MKIVSTNAFAIVVRELRKAKGIARVFPDPGKPLYLYWIHSGTKKAC